MSPVEGPVCQNCGAALTSRQRRCPECGTLAALPRRWAPSILVTVIVVLFAGALLAVGYAQISDDAGQEAAAPSPKSSGKKVVPPSRSTGGKGSQKKHSGGKRGQGTDSDGQKPESRSR
jgi:hypothetical protein